jgi:dUTP pyrophosphatase
MQIKFKNTSDNPSPKYGSQFAAGFDICANVATESKKTTINPYSQKLIGTGLFIEVPTGYYLQLKSRSGLAVKRNLHVGAGVIDSDYRGEIHILLINQGEAAQTIDNGDRIAQGIILPYVQAQFELVNELSETMRGDGGFGSTGIGGEQSKVLVKDEALQVPQHKKPNPVDYGWCDNAGFDSEPSFWAIEEGEEEYNKALKLWELSQQSK